MVAALQRDRHRLVPGGADRGHVLPKPADRKLELKALLGKGCVPDDNPYTTGGIGLLGTRPSQEAIEECDTVFLVGTSFPYLEFLPKKGQARGVQLDIDPTRKTNLVNGWDEIGLTLRHADEIKAYEEKRKKQEPWIFQ